MPSFNLTENSEVKGYLFFGRRGDDSDGLRTVKLKFLVVINLTIFNTVAMRVPCSGGVFLNGFY